MAIATAVAALTQAAPARAGEPSQAEERAPLLRGVRPLDQAPPGWRTRAFTPVALRAHQSTAPPLAESAALAAALDAARAEAMAYGMTMAVVHDGRLIWSGASGVDRDGSRRLAAGDPLVIGSVTKTFVAAIVLQLVEEERIGLDDEVAGLVPAAAQVTGRATVRHLLQHTSGLADVFNATSRASLESAPERVWSHAEALSAVSPRWFEPGEDWAYSNTNYLVLGMLVERVLEVPLEQAIRDRLSRPLALASVQPIPVEGEQPAALSPGWASLFWGSGSMVASAGDLARWGDALYRGTGVLDAATHATMLDFNEDDHGLGVQRVVLGAHEGHGHSGLLHTYTSLLVHLPEAKLTVAVIVNRAGVDLNRALLAAQPAGSSILDLALAAAGVQPATAAAAP